MERATLHSVTFWVKLTALLIMFNVVSFNVQRFYIYPEIGHSVLDRWY